MAVYTQLNADEITHWLAHYNLGELQQWQGIAAGYENTIYQLHTDQGHYILTLFEHLAEPQLSYCLQLAQHLNQQGIPCPAPYLNQQQQTYQPLHNKPAAIFPFFPGSPLSQPTTQHCQQLGQRLGQIHQQGQSFHLTTPHPQHLALWQQQAQPLLATLASEDQALLLSELDEQRALQWDSLPQGAIHGDLFRDNLLWQNDQISAILDFNNAGHGPLLFDLAICINDWCVQDNALETERVHALMSSYQQQRPLSFFEMDVWRMLLRAAALRFWLSRLQAQKYLARQQLAIPAKDPQVFRDLLIYHRSYF